MLKKDLHITNQMRFDILLNISNNDEEFLSKYLESEASKECTYDHKFDRYLADYYFFFNNCAKVKEKFTLQEDSFVKSIYELPITDVLVNEYYKNIYFAEYYFSKEKYKESIEYFEKAVKINPIERNCNYCKLIYMFTKLGDKQSAIKYSALSTENFSTFHSIYNVIRKYYLTGEDELVKVNFKLAHEKAHTELDYIKLAELYILTETNMSEDFSETLKTKMNEVSMKSNEFLQFVATKYFLDGEFNQLNNLLNSDKLSLTTKAISYIAKNADKLNKKKMRKFINENKSDRAPAWDIFSMQEILEFGLRRSNLKKYHRMFKSFLKEIEK